MDKPDLNNIKVTVHYESLEKSTKKISVHQGGARSGKTYNILTWFIIKLLREENKTFTIVRKTMPSILSSVQRDFFEILKRLGVYDPTAYKDQKKEYHLRGNNLIQFKAADDEQKIRGAKRDYLFINEANELSEEEWFQLIARTTTKAVLDYNPSDEYHWIYETVVTRDDCDFYKSTFRDNPFIEDTIKDEIERLQFTNPQRWRVFGLGERGISEAKVFQDWGLIDSFASIPSNEIYYGLDFGWQDPTAFVAVKIHDGGIYIDELLYKSYVTSASLIQFLKLHIPSGYYKIYGDSSRPDTIEELKLAGINILRAKKGKDSIKHGINFLLSHKIYITKRSQNILREFKRYEFKRDKRSCRLTDEFVDFDNHSIDAIRYALCNKRLNSNSTTLALLKGFGVK
jgi:phage terminase large subunit